MPSTKASCEPLSELLLPHKALAGAIVLALLRDTRGANLSASQRFNHFFTSPFCAITWVFHGQCHLLTNQEDMENPAAAQPMGKISFSGPNTRPVVTWNPGDVQAMTIGFYPDAWHALSGMKVAGYLDRMLPLSEVNALELNTIANAIVPEAQMGKRFEQFQSALAPLWKRKRAQSPFVAQGISDWLSATLSRAAIGNAGKSQRQAQRRLKNLTGQSHRELMAHARAESLFAQYVAGRDQPRAGLSTIALDTGYADQSHMGREVRRFTGLSPARIDKLIDTEERYWCYRLLENYYS